MTSLIQSVSSDLGGGEGSELHSANLLPEVCPFGSSGQESNS
jgi:hypothetical protein